MLLANTRPNLSPPRTIIRPVQSILVDADMYIFSTVIIANLSNTNIKNLEKFVAEEFGIKMLRDFRYCCIIFW